MRIKPLLASVFVLCLCATASAADYPPAVQNLVDNGVTIVKQFDAGSGLTGYVIQANSQYGIIYGMDDGQRVLIGRILDANGQNVTAKQADKYVPHPDLSQAWQQLEQSNWIAEGADDPKTIVYEFTDPNCPYCHLMWLANQPYMDVGLQVRHILVGIVTPSSKGKAAAILEADDPSAAFQTNEKDYRMDVPEDQAGAIEPLDDPKPETLAKLEANAALMRKLGVRGTPGVFYKSEDGKVHMVSGLPKLSKLPAMYNLPQQTIDNPKLDKYK